MTVTGCDDCPMQEEHGPPGGTWTECGHPEVAERMACYETAPDWCPLRKGPLTIALETEGT